MRGKLMMSSAGFPAMVQGHERGPGGLTRQVFYLRRPPGLFALV
jgi:hypothetical protein